MQEIDLLCMHPGKSDLNEFSSAFFDAFDIVDVERRESLNYPGGFYFRGRYNGLRFTVYLEEEESDEGFFSLVVVGEELDQGRDFAEVVDRLVRGRLLTTGFRVSRIVNYASRNPHYIDYV